MSFQDHVKRELENYKKETLDIEEKGKYNYRGNILKYDHILPKNLERQNIIPHIREEFYNSKYSEIKFHRYFHHLNSSQALCINLIYPLIQNNQLYLLKSLLGKDDSNISELAFEFESDIEITNSRKTNFDFFLKFSDGERSYFEIKYTESEFGKAKKDEAHIDKFNKTYLPLLTENPYIESEYKELDNFLDSYQIMRNLVHISSNSTVVFLYPKDNKTIHRQADFARENILTIEGKERFKLLHLKPVVDFLSKNLETKYFKNYYQEFKEKYLNYDNTY